MKYSLLCLCAVICTLLAACNKKADDPAKDCGDDKATGFPTISGKIFLQYETEQSIGDADYNTGYTSNGVLCAFTFSTYVHHVCPKENVTVSPVLGLKLADTSVHMYLIITSLDGNQVSEPVNPGPNGKVYAVNEVYPFNTTSSTETNYQVANSIGFQTHGGWAADSAYFFGTILDSYGCQTSYKTIK